MSRSLPRHVGGHGEVEPGVLFSHFGDSNQPNIHLVLFVPGRQSIVGCLTYDMISGESSFPEMYETLWLSNNLRTHLA